MGGAAVTKRILGTVFLAAMLSADASARVPA